MNPHSGIIDVNERLRAAAAEKMERMAAAAIAAAAGALPPEIPVSAHRQVRSDCPECHGAGYWIRSTTIDGRMLVEGDVCSCLTFVIVADV